MDGRPSTVMLTLGYAWNGTVGENKLVFDLEIGVGESVQ